MAMAQLSATEGNPRILFDKRGENLDFEEDTVEAYPFVPTGWDSSTPTLIGVARDDGPAGSSFGCMNWSDHHNQKSFLVLAQSTDAYQDIDFTPELNQQYGLVMHVRSAAFSGASDGTATVSIEARRQSDSALTSDGITSVSWDMSDPGLHNFSFYVPWWVLKTFTDVASNRIRVKISNGSVNGWAFIVDYCHFGRVVDFPNTKGFVTTSIDYGMSQSVASNGRAYQVMTHSKPLSRVGIQLPKVKVGTQLWDEYTNWLHYQDVNPESFMLWHNYRQTMNARQFYSECVLADASQTKTYMQGTGWSFRPRHTILVYSEAFQYKQPADVLSSFTPGDEVYWV